ncbi:hypothetical protein LR48_Vigan01g109100 [Vigna angularis]|uniref:Uncharacterized protein n=1 Tax=Phaseolus angularis TaxID=3914 RepID=A0A0L9TM54_PHAAN|nr:hypothetical protein LR48_Vigan01g109100 [Vigna angularis]
MRLAASKQTGTMAMWFAKNVEEFQGGEKVGNGSGIEDQSSWGQPSREVTLSEANHPGRSGVTESVGSVLNNLPDSHRRGLMDPNGREPPNPNVKGREEPNGITVPVKGRIVLHSKRGKESNDRKAWECEPSGKRSYFTGKNRKLLTFKEIMKTQRWSHKFCFLFRPPPKPPDLNWWAVASGFPSYDNKKMKRSQEIKLLGSNLENKVVLQRDVTLGYRIIG